MSESISVPSKLFLLFQVLKYTNICMGWHCSTFALADTHNWKWVLKVLSCLQRGFLPWEVSWFVGPQVSVPKDVSARKSTSWDSKMIKLDKIATRVLKPLIIFRLFLSTTYNKACCWPLLNLGMEKYLSVFLRIPDLCHYTLCVISMSSLLGECIANPVTSFNKVWHNSWVLTNTESLSFMKIVICFPQGVAVPWLQCVFTLITFAHSFATALLGRRGSGKGKKRKEGSISKVKAVD